jgi:hypothetical protein
MNTIVFISYSMIKLSEEIWKCKKYFQYRRVGQSNACQQITAKIVAQNLSNID